MGSPQLSWDDNIKPELKVFESHRDRDSMLGQFYDMPTSGCVIVLAAQYTINDPYARC
jgi:hypothetical protein